MVQEERRIKMAYKLKVRNKIYDLRDGFTVKEELNETLDSATKLEFKTYHEEFVGVPFDHVTIYDTNNKISEKHMLVDTYDDEVYSFEEDLEESNHTYSLKLISETKGLERITLPNLVVTQPTSENATKLTVRDILDRYKIYLPFYKKYSSSATNKFTYEYRYSYSFNSKVNNAICPEFQWNNPTFREVLTDLLSVSDCIPTVKKGVISQLDLNVKGSAIDTTKISYSKRTMSSGDFAGELTANIKNGIGKSPMMCCEYITLTAPDGSGTLTTENGIIKTQHPIYNIKKLICYVFDHIGNEDYPSGKNFHKVDVSSRTIEKEEWDLLSDVYIKNSGNYNALPSKTDANGFSAKEHRVNYLYYERGGRTIHNIANVHSGSSLSDVYKTFYFSVIGMTLVNVEHTINNPHNLGITYAENPRELFFYIEYETMSEHPVHVGKYLPSYHPDNRIFDNQENSYADINRQISHEHSKIERLGNKVREIYGEYFNESDIPNLGDYIGDEILFSREITYYDDILLFKGYLTPRYVLKDYYTGLVSKKRSWELASGNEALVRHDIYKFYIEASFIEKHDRVDTTQSLTRSISKTFDEENYYEGRDDNEQPIWDYTYAKNVVTEFIKSIHHSTYRSINHAVIVNQTGMVHYPQTASDRDGLVMDISVESADMSLCFNFGFNDNIKGADYIIHDDEYFQNWYNYAKKTDGTFNVTNVYLVGKTKEQLPLNIEDYPGVDPTTQEDAQALVEKMYSRPLIDTRDAVKDEYYYSPEDDDKRFYYHFYFNVNKDNREIIKSMIQFEYCSDTPDIIITPAFVENCPLKEQKFKRLFLYLSPAGFKYGLKDTKAPSGAIKYYYELEWPAQYNEVAHHLEPMENNYYSAKIWWDDYIGSDVDFTHNQPGVPDTTDVEYGSWAIGLDDGTILLAVNKSDRTPVYFNLLRSRDDKVYTNGWSQEVRGDIGHIDDIH